MLLVVVQQSRKEWKDEGEGQQVEEKADEDDRRGLAAGRHRIRLADILNLVRAGLGLGHVVVVAVSRMELHGLRLIIPGKCGSLQAMVSFILEPVSLICPSW